MCLVHTCPSFEQLIKPLGMVHFGFDNDTLWALNSFASVTVSSMMARCHCNKIDNAMLSIDGLTCGYEALDV